ncbi:hypothetical protein SAMN05519103_09014 [Rhizobiales bacterium GAS113]|nr:hypothetical protein SAMN05519103_09014 [Rhizobiales bacterium GAS113]
MESAERRTLDVFDDNLDDEEAVLEGHLLDLYAQRLGYHSFGAYAASMFRRGQWLFFKIAPPRDGYVVNGSFHPTREEAIAACEDLDEAEPRQAFTVTCESRLHETSRPIREMTKYVKRFEGEAQPIDILVPRRRRRG